MYSTICTFTRQIERFSESPPGGCPLFVSDFCSHLNLNNRFLRPKRDGGGGDGERGEGVWNMVNYDTSAVPGHTRKGQQPHSLSHLWWLILTRHCCLLTPFESFWHSFYLVLTLCLPGSYSLFIWFLLIPFSFWLKLNTVVFKFTMTHFDSNGLILAHCYLRILSPSVSLCLYF